MAVDRFPVGPRSLRAAMQPVRLAPEVTWDTASGSATSGLALVAEAEQQDSSDRVVGVATALEFNPLFWLAVQDYTKLLAQLVVQPKLKPADHQEQASFALRLLCARMFLAGVLACGRSDVPHE